MLTVLTNKPIAYDSIDYQIPCGIMNDNTTNQNFVDKILSHLKEQGIHQVKYLDLGCAGGGLVKQFIDAGHLGVGIDGSDYRRQNRLPEWHSIPSHLFTADITEYFEILAIDVENKQTIKFDIIALWEVMEHISDEKIPQLIANVKYHLTDNGLLMLSISKDQQIHHVNIKEFENWDRVFEEYGFKRETTIEELIGTDFPRGPSQLPMSGSPRVINNIRRVYSK